jgi:1-acyl-sn-glycerol-3-phosphate acyltransferase
VGRARAEVEVPDAPVRPRGLYGFTLIFVKAAARLGWGLGARTVSGREHIPKTGGFIVASNHASLFDPPVIAVASPRQLSYIAKMELFANPIFSAVIRALGAFPVRRGAGDREALAASLAFLRKGHGLVLFPEGTRTLTGELGRLKPGAAMLAVKARVPIVPVWIEGTFQAWPKNGRIRLCPVSVRIGEPIATADLPDRAESFRALTARLEESLRALSGRA